MEIEFIGPAFKAVRARLDRARRHATEGAAEQLGRRAWMVPLAARIRPELVGDLAAECERHLLRPAGWR